MSLIDKMQDMYHLDVRFKNYVDATAVKHKVTVDEAMKYALTEEVYWLYKNYPDKESMSKVEIACGC